MARTATGRSRGGPAKPTALKRKLGNPGGRPLPPQRDADVLSLVHAAEARVPEPPRTLGVHGTAVWQRIWMMGQAWIELVDQDAILLMCEQFDERSLLRSRVLRDADRYDRMALRAIEAQIAAGLSSLGFTPTDRARMNIGEIGSVDPLEELRRRRQA